MLWNKSTCQKKKAIDSYLFVYPYIHRLFLVYVFIYSFIYVSRSISLTYSFPLFSLPFSCPNFYAFLQLSLSSFSLLCFLCTFTIQDQPAVISNMVRPTKYSCPFREPRPHYLPRLSTRTAGLRHTGRILTINNRLFPVNCTACIY